MTRTIASGVGCLIVGMLSIPFLAVGISDSDGTPAFCPLHPHTSLDASMTDGSPTILGPSTLTATQLIDWWDARRGTQPARLSIPIHDAIGLYLSEAAAEGVRGDLMLAQSIVETGWFTNRDTEINNFAGIGHHDDRTSGYPYPDARTGIRAQVQLLKKFAAGNDTALVNPDLGITAGRHATTWAGLAGTWATNPDYWAIISGVYAGMLTHHDLDPTNIIPATVSCTTGVALAFGPIVDDDGRAWSIPVSADVFDLAQLDHPHHTYPAWDLIIPEGVPIHAITNGVVASVRNWPYNWWHHGCGRDPTGCDTCGIGITIASDNGLRHTYCHLSATHLALGDHVSAGQQVGLSGDTGRSGTPHLHLELRVDGVRYCPQPILNALYTGNAGPFTWTTTGCVF